MKKLILSLLLLASPLYADARKYSYGTPQLNNEVDSIYHDLLYLNAVNVKASTGTFNYVNIATGTFAQMNSSSGTIKSFMVVGTATNDSAPTGRIGEQIVSTNGRTNYPATGVFGELTSINLTPGDWDVSAVLDADANGATVTTQTMGISSTIGDFTTGLVDGDNRVYAVGPTAAADSSQAIPSYRISISGAATYYLKYRANYSVAIPRATGRISARRVR